MRREVKTAAEYLAEMQGEAKKRQLSFSEFIDRVRYQIPEDCSEEECDPRADFDAAVERVLEGMAKEGLQCPTLSSD